MECVHAFVVESSLKDLPVEHEVSLGNAVGIATNGGAEVSILVIHVGIERTITECEIAEPPFAVLCLEGDNPSTKGNDPELNVRAVERVGVDDRSIGKCAEDNMCSLGHC